MTKRQLRFFLLERWKAVETIQHKELRAMTIDQRYNQLVNLMSSARLFPQRSPNTKELLAVRRRWGRLRKRMVHG